MVTEISPATVNNPSATVIRSVSSVCPIVVPLIKTSSISNDPPLINPVVVIADAPVSTVPANVASAPLKVKAVVGVVPDLISNSPPDCDKLPYVVPSSLRVTSAPPASRTTSPAESKVIVVPSASKVPSAVSVIFASAAAVSVVTIDNVPFVPAVNTAVSLLEPVMVITLPSTATSSTVNAVKVPSEVILV